MKVFYGSTRTVNRLGLKSQAHSPSPFKWTNGFFNPLQRTFAISPEINDAVGEILVWRRIAENQK